MDEQLTIFDFIEHDHGKVVRPIGSDDARPFIMKIHYARRMPCIQYAFGLFEDEKLIGVVTFGQPASPSLCVGVAGEENKMNVLELNRLVMLPEKNDKNNASFLVGGGSKAIAQMDLCCQLCRLGRMASRWVCIPSNELPIHWHDKRTH